MIRSILSLLLFLAGNALVAQQPFTVSNTEPFIDSEMKDDISITVGVANTTDSTINLVWEREEVTLPTDWASAICDPVRCWAPTVDTKVFSVEADARNIELIAHVYPELNTPGMALIRVNLYEDNHPNDNVIIDYTFNVGLTNSLSEVEQRSVKLFPNPTSSGNFTMDVALSKAKEVRLSLVNAIGQTVYARDYGSIGGTQRLTYEGAPLPAGMYYLMLEVEESTSAYKLMVVR